MKTLPTIIAARDGSRALHVLELAQVGGVQNRDAVGYRFRVRNTPHGEPFPLTVIFSGTVYSVKAEAFELPEIESREERFTQFALAAIGDAIDAEPIQDADGKQVTPIECFSPHFQSWRDRQKADATVVRRYLQAHSYWAWEYGADTTRFGMPDALRLGIRFELLRREAELYDGQDWLLGPRARHWLELDRNLDFVRRARHGDVFSAPLEAGLANQGTEEPGTTDMTDAALPPEPISGLTYVDESRIAELRLIDSEAFDLSRLIALCDELNITYRSQCYLSVAALLRAILDHIAPIFGYDAFTRAANNYSGGSTFRRNALRLDEAARDVANLNLHRRIAKKETLPTRVQVHFASELDIVLEEVVRILG